jgi:hypothetical protein
MHFDLFSDESSILPERGQLQRGFDGGAASFFTRRRNAAVVHLNNLFGNRQTCSELQKTSQCGEDRQGFNEHRVQSNIKPNPNPPRGRVDESLNGA